MKPVYLDRNEVLAAASKVDIEAAIRRILADAVDGLAGQTVRNELRPESMPGLMGIMPSFRAREPRLFASKVVCVMPQNPGKGLPAHQGICALFDGEDGHIIGLAEAGSITELRTSAIASIATQALASKPGGRHLLIGSGHQVLPHLEALNRAGLADDVMLWARNDDAARRVSRSAAERGIDVPVAQQLDEAVRDADIVTTLTGASKPILDADWLKPGAHVNAMGSSTPFVREFGDDLIERARVFVDDLDSALSLAGEFVHSEVDPEARTLGSILVGEEKVRTAPEEITLFKSVGIGIQDLALLECIFQAA